ncbi:uncharacterized protein [Spinacia oleracea]|uniref:Uncharacterized protein n=1 Tax=Spinacia oleracea TaxID=3562 RepID=A0ABM3RBL2_SPIOL|nr:uncharacterized protein LOC130467925 [Spinacia oleracea]
MWDNLHMNNIGSQQSLSDIQCKFDFNHSVFFPERRFCAGIFSLFQQVIQDNNMMNVDAIHTIIGIIGPNQRAASIHLKFTYQPENQRMAPIHPKFNYQLAQ